MHRPTSPWIHIVLILVIATLYYMVLYFSRNGLLVEAQLLMLFLPAAFMSHSLKLTLFRWHEPHFSETWPRLTANVQKLGSHPSRTYWLIVTLCTSLLVAFGTNAIVNTLQESWGMGADYEAVLQSLMHTGSWQGFVRDMMALAFIPAVCEEWLFRGYLQPVLKQFFSFRTSLVIAAFLFAFYHLNPLFFIFYFGLGLYFGYLAHASGHLTTAMIAHFVFNAYGIVSMHTSGGS